MTAMTDAMSLSQQQQNTIHLPSLNALPRQTPPQLLPDQHHRNRVISSSYISSPRSHGFQSHTCESLMGPPSLTSQRRAPLTHSSHFHNPGTPRDLGQYPSSWMGLNSNVDNSILRSDPHITPSTYLNNQTLAMHISTPSSSFSEHATGLHHPLSATSRETQQQYLQGAYMQPPPHETYPLSLHAQSYSDAYSSCRNRQLNDDFGYALQRPGVVPSYDLYGNNNVTNLNGDWYQSSTISSQPHQEINIHETYGGATGYETMHQYPYIGSVQTQQRSNSFAVGMGSPHSTLRRNTYNHGGVSDDHASNISYSQDMETRQGTSLLAQALAAENSAALRQQSTHLQTSTRYEGRQVHGTISNKSNAVMTNINVPNQEQIQYDGDYSDTSAFCDNRQTSWKDDYQ